VYLHLRRICVVASLLALVLAAPSALAALQNAAPANKLGGYAGYELVATQLAPGIEQKRNAEKVLGQIEANIQKHVAPVVAAWNGKADASAPNKLRLEPVVISLHKPSGANRFWAGGLAGQAKITIKVRIIEVGTDKVIGEPEFYQHANAVAGAWTIGATDNLMLDRVAKLVAEYLVGNYEQPVGGKSGYED
jgi:hypothetical protein